MIIYKWKRKAAIETRLINGNFIALNWKEDDNFVTINESGFNEAEGNEAKVNKC